MVCTALCLCGFRWMDRIFRMRKLTEHRGTAQETVEFDASAVQNYVSGLTRTKTDKELKI